MKTILMRSQTTLMASTLSLLQAQSSLFSSVIGLQPACFRLQSACNRLDRACNRPATGLFSSVIGLQQAQCVATGLFSSAIRITGSIEPVASRLQARSSLLQADYRLNRACCKPITGSIEPVASRLQTKTSRLQACCNIYFSPLSNCSQFKSAKKGFENEKCLKIPFFLLQTRSNVKLFNNKNV